MMRRLKLFVLMAMIFTISNCFDASADDYKGPALFSPSDGAYINGESTIYFYWGSINGYASCDTFLQFCSDPSCNYVIDGEGANGQNLTSAPISFNYANDGTSYYWQVYAYCIDELNYSTDTWTSHINKLTTYDEATSATITATPSSSVIEGHPVTLTVQASGAQLEDYLYQYTVNTYLKNSNGTKTLYNTETLYPTTNSSYTWNAPSYNDVRTYELEVGVGTSSYQSFYGNFVADIPAWTSSYTVLPSSYPVITPPNPIPDAMYNKPYNSGPMGVTGGQGQYTWEIYVPIGDSYNLPSGLSVDPNTGAISGTPKTSNQNGMGFLFYIQVKDARGLTATAPITLNVYPTLSISPSYLPDTLINTHYTQSIVATGGKPPYSNWVISGSLPDGLTFDPSTGIINGTPTSSGNFPFTVSITDLLNNVAENSYNIFVYPPVSITTQSLPNGTISKSYTQTLTATGGDSGTYCWSLPGGSLPAGLALSTNGVITGTPTTAGSSSFSVLVKDCQNSTLTANGNFSINTYPALTINPITLPSGSIGNPYNQTLSATGGYGSYTWTIASGSGGLPPGLTLSSAGVISGAPQSGGNCTFTVQVSDSQSPTPATATASFTINVPYNPLQVTTASLSSGTAGTLYNQSLAVTGGAQPYSWSILGLPAGLKLDSSSGIISGLPADVGNFNITVQVTDSLGTQTAPQSYSFNITNGFMQLCTDTPASPDVCTNSTTNVMTGVVNHDQELFSAKGAPMGTAIQLFYKSLPFYNGPLGIGWSHTYDIFLVMNGDGSVVLQSGGNKSFYTSSGSGYTSPPGDYSTLAKNADGTYVITYRDGHKYNFRTDGKIVSMTDRFNNIISFGYTGGDLTSITDQVQRSTNIVYDQTVTPHRISSITDPNHNEYDFTYQGNTLYHVTNPVADPSVNQVRGYWEYQYNPDNTMKSKMDPNGNTSSYTYYADQRMWKATDPQGQTRTIVYPTSTGTLLTTTFIEKDNGQWLYTYDSQIGAIKQKTDPNGKLTKYTFYPNGNIKSITVPKDGATSLTTFYTYDSYGNLLTKTNPIDLSTYTPAIDPETVTDPRTLANLSPPIVPAFSYTYDNSNFDLPTGVSDNRVTPSIATGYVYTTENGGEVVTATATPGNYTTVTKKNPDGTVRQVVDANGKSTVFTYYPNTTANSSAEIVGLLQTATDPAGVVTTISSYDTNGNPQVTTVQDTAGTVRLTSSQQYDALNQLKLLTKTTSTLPNIVTTYGHDYMGNLSTLLDAENHLTSYFYNYNRKPIKITDAKLNDTVFTYSGSEGNGVDKLVGIFDANVTKNTTLANQPHTAFNYDKLNRLQYETDQLGKIMYYTYYDNGLVKEKYDASNGMPGTLLITHIYNNLGQVTDKNFTDGTYEHFTYYPDGKLWTATNQNISYTYNYNNDGRLQSVTDTTNSRTISYDQYDGLGQRKQVTILKGSGADERVISYDYDLANRPWHITSGAGAFMYSYDTLGRRNTLAYPNNTSTTWGFDDLNRLTVISHAASDGTVIANFSYPHYDNVGNRKDVSGTKNESYQYDELYRLLSVNTTLLEAFNYDYVGNRQNGPGPADLVYAYNNANQMTQGRVLGYGYDDFGNQNTRTAPGAIDKSWVQTWDYQNRLIMVQKTKGAETRTVTFTYDPLGHRIGKQMAIVKNGVTQTQAWSYVYDGDSIAVEIYTDENNTTTKTFYTEGSRVDEHLALERNGQFYYYHADGLGSVASITDAGHNVAQSYNYDSYGMVTPANDFRNGYAYTGREWDKETGLYYYRARYYDPMEGRFISKDPIGVRGGINQFAYVLNNPINFVDLFGLDLTPAQQAAVQAAAQDWADSNVPYKYGGSSKKGADCSGSVSSIYKQAGIDIGRLASQGFKNTSLFSPAQGAPQVGDVGVYKGHVVIYGGNTDPDDTSMNVWSASHTGGPVFGPANSSWFGKPAWYRYNGN